MPLIVPESTIYCFTHHTQAQALRSYISAYVKAKCLQFWQTLREHCITDKHTGARCHSKEFNLLSCLLK